MLMCSVIMFIFGIFSFCSLRSHLLLTLLSLEFLMLSLYLILFIYLCFHGISYYFSMIFLIFIVCEGALGLGILVCLIRSHGSDMVMGLSVLSW